MARFDGKRVLITGGTSGIGLATAKIVAAEGGRVAITGRKQDKLDAALAELPDGALGLVNDAADPASGPALAAEIEKAFGGIDAVFLNAGFGNFAPIEELTAEHIDALFAANVRGPSLHLQALRPLLGEGSNVLVTGSVSPYIGQAGGSIYAATKGAVAGLVRAWAAELAPAGIRVNNLAPGPIETNFFEGTGMSEEQGAQFAEMIMGMVPLSRFGKSGEAANVAAFLLSDDASYVTGSEYMVDGGISFR